MQIVDSQIHLWENARMSPQHRQIPTYSMDDALQEMAGAGVDAAVIIRPARWERRSTSWRSTRCANTRTNSVSWEISTQSPDRLNIVKNWRQRPGMLGFRFTFNQPHQQSWWSDGSLDWFWAACEQKAASRPAGRWPYGRPREDRRAPSRAEAAYRPLWSWRWWQCRDR